MSLLLVLAKLSLLFGVVGLGGSSVARLVQRRHVAHVDAIARVRAMPPAVTLIQLVAATGVGPRVAVSMVGELSFDQGDIGLVIRQIQTVATRLEMGASFSELLLDESADESMSRVLDVLRRAEINGSALGVHLDFLVRDLRRARSGALDAAAQRLTVSLLVPLVVCILPAFVLLAVVPLVLEGLSGLPG